MPRSLEPLLEPFQAIGLEACTAAAGLGDRLDVKYIVPVDALGDLTRRLLRTHRVLEIAGLRHFEYRTTYFDTADLVTYRHHVQGRRRRFKCRAREYVDSGLRLFEVKLRGGGGRTVKHRTPLTGQPADRLDAELLRFVGDHVREEPAALQRTLDMRYTRFTLVDPDRGERLTCDVELRFAAPDGNAGRLAAGRAIVESKSRAGGARAEKALRDLGIRPVASCSKYCLGVGQTYPQVKRNAFLPLLRDYFEPDRALLAAV